MQWLRACWGSAGLPFQGGPEDGSSLGLGPAGDSNGSDPISDAEQANGAHGNVRKKFDALRLDFEGSAQRCFNQLPLATLSSSVPVPPARELALHACYCIVDTQVPGWPILHCSDMWSLWSGWRRQDALGKPLQQLLRSAQMGPGSLRWPQLEMAVQERQRFVLCDVVRASPAMAAAACCSGYLNASGPASSMSATTRSCTEPGTASTAVDPGHPPCDPAAWLEPYADLNSLSEALNARQQQGNVTAAGQKEGMYTHSTTISQKLAACTCGAADSSPESSSGSNARADTKFDLVFHPLPVAAGDEALLVTDMLGCSLRKGASQLANLYTVHVLQPSAFPRPVEPLLPAVKMDRGAGLSLGALSSAFWPGIKLGRKLGSGSYGTALYGVWHEVEVVVKVQDKLLEDSKQFEEAQQEVLLGCQLDHPNIARILSHATVKLNDLVLTPQSVVRAEPIQYLAIELSSAKGHKAARLGKSNPGLASALLAPLLTAVEAVDRTGLEFPMFLRSLQLMEFCNAGTLQDCLERGWLCLPRVTKDHTMPTTGCGLASRDGLTHLRHARVQNVSKVLLVVQDVCAAMQHMHSLGVVHADISATNVLMCTCGPRGACDQGTHTCDEWDLLFDTVADCSDSTHASPCLVQPWLRAKVSDLGAAKQLDAGGDTVVPCCGTANYLAPEAMMHKVASTATDMYSVGSLIYQICHQEAPWSGLSRSDIQGKLASGLQLRWTARLWPAGLADLGKRCCSLDPSMRPTAAQAVEQLQLLLAEVSGPR